MASLALAQFMGLYILIVSAVALLRKEEYRKFAYGFAENRELRYVVAFFELAAGLAIVLFSSGWTAAYEAIITVFGWMMAVESVFFLFASEGHATRLIEILDHDWYWIGASILTVFIGLYLIAVGFGLF